LSFTEKIKGERYGFKAESLPYPSPAQPNGLGKRTAKLIYALKGQNQ
jgi:hypothetical protein